MNEITQADIDVMQEALHLWGKDKTRSEEQRNRAFRLWVSFLAGEWAYRPFCKDFDINDVKTW